MPRPSLPPQARARGVTAVLGPTNTGKTHLAIERMLAHSSGMIGLPLRLLAREVYHRVVERVGADAVALVTGEEKIRPRHPRYWICTAEAMPRDLDLAFVGIDEIQLGADMDRGHTFTDRLLHQRGREETLLIGSSTMRPLVEALIPDVHVTTRPRLSTLSFAGEKKLSRLPPRTAIVAFSAEEVYAVAELIRRQRGGAAVVLGALSPRTRNAQVDLYQAGDVDYLVATDAVGMGLNLDVDHVAFAANRKYDGTRFRLLSPSELAQIAGRAGRHMRDGTFGTTGRCPPMEPEIVEALESHTFEPLRVLQWRNPDLRFETVAALQESLAEHPSERGLTRAPMGEDVAALDSLARDTDIRDLARGRAAVERLWAVCGVPDYQKAGAQNHADLVSQLYRFLAKGMAGRIPAEWFAQHVAGVDRTDGDIDALSNRIAQVRTWTFVANRSDWLADPEHWQAETRRVEDRLSDALHERLASRFVDRRTSVLMRRLRENTIMDAEITPTGDVTVEGQHVGHLHGFQFAPDPGAEGTEAKTLRNAAERALASEIEARAGRFAATPDATLVLSNDGTIRWTGDPVAKVVAGEKLMAPGIRVIADEQLTGPALEKVTGRLEAWLKAHVVRLLGPVMELESAAELSGLARGIAFQIAESLGVLERSRVVQEMRSLDQDGRANLRRHGVRFGAYHLYLPALLKPAPRTLATLLFALKHGGLDQKGPDELAHLAGSGRTSMTVDPEIAKGLYRAAGFRVCGNRAVRVDILERLADLIRPAIAYRPGLTPGEPPPGSADGETFVPTVSMTSLVGCSGEDFSSILKSLGYTMDRRAGPAITAPLVPMAAKVPAAPVAAASHDEPTAENDASIQGEPPAQHDVPAPETLGEETGGDAEETAVATSEEDASQAVAESAEPPVDVPDPPEAVALPSIEGGLGTPAPPVAETAAEAPEIIAETSAPSVPSESTQAPAPDEAAAPPMQEVTSEASTAVEAGDAAAEPVLIEVWRQHRHQRQNQPSRGERVRHDGRNRGESRRGEGQGEPRRERHHGRGGAPGQAGDQSPAGVPGHGSAAVREGGAPAREPNARGEARDVVRPGRPPRERREGGRSFEGRGTEARGPESREDRRPPRRERGPDPDSPFAKLLALKAQLESQDGGKR